MAQQYGMSSIPNATDYLKSIKPIPAPTLNFGAPMSGQNIKNFSESGIKQAPKTIPKPTTPTSGGFSLVPKANASGNEYVVKQALSDIDAGMPIEEFDSIYPELLNKKQIFQEYANDIKAGMPKSEGPKLYPELFGGETQEKPGLWSQLGTAAKESLPNPMNILEVGGNVAKGLEKNITGAVNIAASPFGVAPMRTPSETIMGVGKTTPSFLERSASTILQRGQELGDVITAKGQTQPESVFQGTMKVARGLLDIGGDAFMSALSTASTQEQKDFVKQELQKAVETKGSEYVMQKMQEAQRDMETLRELDPRAARNFEAVFTLLEGAGEAVGLGTGTRTLKATGKATEEFLGNVTGNAMQGVEKTGETLGKGINKTSEVLGKGVEKVADTASTIGKTLEEGGEKFRNTLAGLDEKEIMALKNTPREEFESILNQAKISKDNDYVQNPYNEGAQKANDAFKQLEQNLETSQKARVETLKNSGIEKIETGKVRQDIVKDIEDTFNIQGVNIVDGKIKYKTTPGRESLLREENIKDYEALKLLENVTKSRTPLQMMDNIKKMQNLIYDSPDGLRVSKDMGNLIKRSIGKLNKSFKEQVGADYAKILDDMATDINLKNQLSQVFKASSGEEILNRGELAMKRLANGTTTSAEARQLALLVKERTGIDLIKEARLRQLAMDLVDDPKGATLFGVIKEGPSGIVSKAMQKAIDLTPFSKEKTALARTQKIPPNNKQNVDSNFNSSTNTNNKKNTNGNTPKIPMGNSGMNDKTLKISAKTQTISGETQKSIKPQLETTLKGATTSNIDEVTQSVAKNKGTKVDSNFEKRQQQLLEEEKEKFLNFLDRQKEGTKNISKLSDIIKNNPKYQSLLKKSEEIQAKNEKAIIGIYSELEGAKAGERIFSGYGSDLEVTGVPSTFPKYIPEKSRTTPILTRIMKHMNDGDVPNPKNINIYEGYIAVLKRFKQLGGDFKIFLTNATEKAIEEIAEKIGAKLNLISDKQGIGVEKTALLKGSDDLKLLIEEARKYKSADEFYDDYTANSIMDLSDRSKHKYGRLLEDGVDEDTMRYMDAKYTADIYGPRGNNEYKWQKDANVPNVNSPDDIVTIYRGTVKSQKNMEPGDFVTFSKEYALSHNEGAKLLILKVPAKDVVWQGADLHEWIYSPEKLRGGNKYTGGLKKIWEQAQKSKPLKKAIPKP